MTAPLRGRAAFDLEFASDHATPADVDQLIEAVLDAADQGTIGQLVLAPPGAGKTELIIDGVAQAGMIHDERVLVATSTREQSAALTRRLVRKYRTLVVTMFVRTPRWVPADLRAHPRVRIETKARDLPTGPCVVVGTVAKFGQSSLAPGSFHTLFLDEVYQIAATQYLPVATLAVKHRGIGDPGQLDTINRIDVTRWRDTPAGVHTSAARVLEARAPNLHITRLHVSRRLLADTVGLIQPAFYPDLPFRALEGAAERHLEFRALARHEPLDEVLRRFERGASVVMAELPDAHPRIDDPGVAELLVASAERLLARGAHVVTPEGATPLTAGDIGIVCPHVQQVGAVQARLSRALRGGVYVETADRYQGLERQVMLVWHPLAGQMRPGAFHMNIGRFCVGLSRHRVACLIVGRAGLDATLASYREETVPILGLDDDLEYGGLRAHRSILAQLTALDRIVPFHAEAVRA